MADLSISELTAATGVQAADLFVLEQSGTAKKLTGQILENWLLSFASSLGGITEITGPTSVGRVDTYTIHYANSATTTTFQVTNGAKGDTGDQTQVWIKWAAQQPTADSQLGDNPDEWIGICASTATTAPTTRSSYKWYKYKGETGDDAYITQRQYRYQQTNTQTQPAADDGNWSTTMPTLSASKYLWTQEQTIWNTGAVYYAYTCTRNGIDGSGAVSTVNGESPDNNGNVTLTASNINASDSAPIQTHLTALETATANQILYFTNVACSATTGNFASYNNPAITSDHVLLECVFSDSSYITSDVTWTTGSGTLTLNGTCTASTTARVVLGKKNN